MKISNAIETPEGTVTFEGELNQAELGLILSIGIEYLFKQGAIPMKALQESELATIADGTETLQ